MTSSWREKDFYVAVWIGSFAGKDDFDQYIEKQFAIDFYDPFSATEDEPQNPFSADFGIEYYDIDFSEALCT